MIAIIGILTSAVALASEATALIQRLQQQGGREPTPEELSNLKMRRDQVERDWASLAPSEPE